MKFGIRRHGVIWQLHLVFSPRAKVLVFQSTRYGRVVAYLEYSHRCEYMNIAANLKSTNGTVKRSDALW